MLNEVKKERSNEILYFILGLVLPLVGLLVWLVMKNGTEIQKVNSKGALTGSLFNIALMVIAFILLGTLWWNMYY